MPYYPNLTSSGEDQPGSDLVVEVERDVFMGLVGGEEKPVVFEHHAGWPKTYRYYVRLGGYYFMFRDREREDLSGTAHVVPVKSFHAGPGSVM